MQVSNLLVPRDPLTSDNHGSGKVEHCILQLVQNLVKCDSMLWLSYGFGFELFLSFFVWLEMATNVQTSLGKIEDSIECSICTHRFREPKWLNCFHTFCLQCLQEICKNQRPPSNKLPCPLCRQETILNGNVSDLPDNLDMKILVNNFTQQENVLKQQFEQLQVFPTLVAKARRSKTEFELSGKNIDKSLTKLDKVFLDTKEKISRKATKEVSRIRDEEQKLIKEAETIHKSKVEFLKSLQTSDRREASQTARKLDEVNHLMSGGSNNGNKGHDFKKRICKDLEKAITKHPQSVPDGLTFMDLKENDVMISLGELVQNDADLILLVVIILVFIG